MRPKANKNAKYLRQYPQIKQFVIRLRREPHIEELVKSIDPPKRKSTRIFQQQQQQQLLKTASKSRTPTKSCGPSTSSVPSVRSRSASIGSLNEISHSADAPTSIMKSAHRFRSKSVSFDLVEDGQTSITDESGCSTQSMSVNDEPIDLTKSSNAASTLIFSDSATQNDENLNYVEISTNQSTNSPASDQILGYQNRIDGLVHANQVKINRLKELIAERNALLAQVEGLHRINRSLTETVDLYRAHDENNQPEIGNDMTAKFKQQIDRAQDEIGVLHARLDRLNHQNYGLNEENKKLKTILGTYSKKVLAEHNYNL